MKKFLLGIAFGATIIAAGYSQTEKPFWLDEKKNEENREPMYASYFVYENEQKANENDWRKSGNYVDINGVWNVWNWTFNYARCKSRFVF